MARAPHVVVTFVLSPHAEQRVVERTSLTPKAVTALLNAPHPVLTGYQPEDNRVHVIFYSERDDDHFFAVTNLRNGIVATILNFRQYRWRFGEVEVTKLFKAKRKVVPNEIRGNVGILLSGRVMRADGSVAVCNLGRTLDFSAATLPEVLAQDPALRALIRERCTERGVDYQALVEVIVREANKDLGVPLPLAFPGSDLAQRARWPQDVAESGS